MKDNQKTNEGAQDLEGLQNFIFEVPYGIDSQ